MDPRSGLYGELNSSACNLVTVLTELLRLLVFESRSVGAYVLLRLQQLLFEHMHFSTYVPASSAAGHLVFIWLVLI